MDEPPGTLVQRIFCCIDVNSRGCVPSHTLLRLLQVSKPSLATRGYIPMTQTRNTSSLCRYVLLHQAIDRLTSGRVR
jgi:hypothetical protein